MGTLAVVGLIATLAGGTYSAISSYKTGIAAQEEAQRQAEAQAELARLQAVAQDAQAAEYARQAQVEKAKAGIEQLQGEMDAERRSRTRAHEIGSAYANMAGNGFLVDAGGSFDDVIKSTNLEAEEDIGIIKANTAMSVWARQESARSLLFSSSQASAAANYSRKSADEYLRAGYAQGEAAYQSGKNQAIGTMFSTLGSAFSGYSKASKN